MPDWDAAIRVKFKYIWIYGTVYSLNQYGTCKYPDEILNVWDLIPTANLPHFVLFLVEFWGLTFFQQS